MASSVAPVAAPQERRRRAGLTLRDEERGTIVHTSDLAATRAQVAAIGGDTLARVMEDGPVRGGRGDRERRHRHRGRPARVDDLGEEPRPRVASGIVLTAEPSAVAGAVSASATGCRGTAPVVCSLGDLDPGAAATITFSARPGVPGQAALTVDVGAAQIDRQPSNNARTAGATVLPPLPGVPAGVTALITDRTAVLRWKDMNTADALIEIERADAPGAPFVRVATIGAGATSFEDAGSSRQAVYRLRAVNAAGPPATRRTSARAAFTIASGDGTLRIPPGGRRTIVVVFAPPRRARYRAALLVTPVAGGARPSVILNAIARSPGR